MAVVGLLLDRAAAGTGGVLVVYGPPGAGRTALAEAAAGEGQRRGFAVSPVVVAAAGPARMAWAQLIRRTGGPGAVARRLLEDAGPLDLDDAADALVSERPYLLVVDDVDRDPAGAEELLPVLAGRVGGSSTAVIVTASAPLGTGQEVRLGPLGEHDLGAVVGESRPEVRRALWLASGGLPGPALSLAGRLAGLDPGADALVHLALCAPSQVTFLAADPPLIRVLETAAGRAVDGPLRARVLARLARELLADPAAGSRRRALVDEALALARAGGEPAVLAEVLDARLHALWDPAAAEDRLAAASEIIDLARAAGDDAHERHGMFWRFVALMELGRVAEAESALAAFERAAQLAGDEAALVMVTARHAMLATLRGRFGEALRLAERVLESGRRAGLADTTDLYAAVRGMVVQEQGTPQEAAVGVDLLLDTARHRPGHLFEATLAGVLATFGRLPEAEAELQRVLPQALGASGPRWLAAMAALAVAASATGDRGAAGALYAALAPYRGRLVIQGGANTTAGPVSHYLGLLATVLGRSDEAAGLFSEAAALAGQIGALPSVAHARAGLAGALAARAGPGAAEAAAEHRRQARSVAERLGMTVLLATLSPPADRWRLRRDGTDWLLDAGDEHARLRDGRGLHYLRALLAAPGHDIPALDLAAGGAGVHPRAAGPVIDEQARSAYRRRLTALAGELDAADRAGDADRGGRLETERQALLSELRRATGMAGRSRDTSPEAERARVNVTRTLRATLARITETAPVAGAHLQASIRTGRACRYQPGAGGPAGWDV
jgi:tetratricopeptide (TPR) repeat protein